MEFSSCRHSVRVGDKNGRKRRPLTLRYNKQQLHTMTRFAPIFKASFGDSDRRADGTRNTDIRARERKKGTLFFGRRRELESRFARTMTVDACC